METILVVDDEKNYLLVMATLLSDEGYEVLTAESAEEAVGFLDGTQFDLVLTDMKMPRMDGIELLTRIKAARPEVPVIMMTAFGTVGKAVEAMKKGAFDYVTKPFQNEELMMTIRKALEMSRLMRENRQMAEALRERFSYGNIIGKSKPMQEIYRLIEKVADTRANVLISGESGTGKELIAKAIHYQSPRAQGPFVAVNCSALAETLLESELFGHEKGAFTDAHSTRKGRFELANGGTLFLDEIGEMPLGLQAKLLRVLQEREFERVGGNVTIKVDVRLVAASNRDLKQESLQGRFREDLFYRLNVIQVHVPPLRERSEDIPLLVAHFIKKASTEAGRSGLRAAPETLRRIYAYPWPGNVRELENALERAVILSSGDTIEPGDLPEDLQDYQEPQAQGRDAGGENVGAGFEVDLGDFIPLEAKLNDVLEIIEKSMILRAMDQTDQVQAHAAQLLGIKKNVMQYKMKKYPPETLHDKDYLSLDVDRYIPPHLGLNEALDAVEKQMILRALDRAGNVQSHAADLLGVNKKVMGYKMKKYGLA